MRLVVIPWLPKKMSEPLPEIQMLWVKGRLSNLERLSVASFLGNGHPVRVFSYEEIPNLPAGAQPEDANHIVPQREVFTNPATVGRGGLSIFSNFFRYRLLWERGGVWSDADLVCIKPMDILASSEYLFGSEVVGRGNPLPTQAQCCIMKVPPKSQLMARSLAIAEQVDLMTAPWASTGPKALNVALAEMNLMPFAQPWDVFCPFPWWHVLDFVRPSNLIMPSATLGVHFYNEIWRRNFIDKDGTYDPLSLFERLKKHYLGEA